MVITGQWGTGKSALLNAGCETAARYGFVVLRCRGRELDGKQRYSLLTALLDSGRSMFSPSSPVPRVAQRLEELLSLSANEGRLFPTIKRVFFDFLVAVRGSGPILIAIDDVDRADPESLDLIRFVLNGNGTQEASALITLPSGTSGEDPHDGLLDALRPRVFSLAPLHVDSVGRMLGVPGRTELDESSVAACHGATSGLPLLVRSLIPFDLALETGTGILTSDVRDQSSSSPISRLVFDKLLELPPSFVRVLQVVALLGDGADPSLVQALADVDSSTSTKAAHAARSSGLLGGAEQYEFSAPLVRWAIHDGIPRESRIKLLAKAVQLAPSTEILLQTSEKSQREVDLFSKGQFVGQS
jgi:hypothetical protein